MKEVCTRSPMSPSVRQMALNPRTPVVIGSGQFVNRAKSLNDAIEPVEMMVKAIELAAENAALHEIPKADAIRVVSLLSWKYKNPAWFIAQILKQNPHQLGYSGTGGNTPQSLVNAAAQQIQSGECDLVILAGGEASRSKSRADKEGVALNWRTPTDATPDPTLVTEELDMNHPYELSRKIGLPIQIYPMFETALRAKAGRTVDQQMQLSGELWSRFSQVAATNPYAWSQKALSPEEICAVSPSNRMIGFPYPKYMNSNNHVDMAAAVIICSLEKAKLLGVPNDHIIFVHSGSDCHEHPYVSNRWSFAQTPAIELGGRYVLDLAGINIDDVGLIDLYSCFPVAVQLGAQSLGLSLDRQLTRTGGLPFAGGPWNNYVMHAIGTMVNDLREQEGELGLVWANGGFASKHAFGIYSTKPPKTRFEYACPQDEIDKLPIRELAEAKAADTARAGPATIEAYTVMHNRDGSPETVITTCLLANGKRAWGTSTDSLLAKSMCKDEWVGRKARLDSLGNISL